MPLTIITELVIRFLPHLIGATALIGAYIYWHDAVYDKGYEAAVALYEQRDLETERQGAELLKLRKHEADLVNEQNAQKAYNAAKIYNEHYKAILDNRNASPSSLSISTKASCDSHTLSGSGSAGSRSSETGKSSHKAELQDENLRKLNAVIEEIELLQLQCEQVLNTVVKP